MCFRVGSWRSAVEVCLRLLVYVLVAVRGQLVAIVVVPLQGPASVPRVVATSGLVWLGTGLESRGRCMYVSCHDLASVFSSSSCIKVCPNLGLSVVIPKERANKLLYLLAENW